MADRQLVNSGTMDGSYNNVPFVGSASSEVTVTLTEVPFTKTADQTLWFNGPLTFTLTVDNASDVSSGVLSNIVIRDQLDTTAFALDTDTITVKIDDNELVLGEDFTYSYDSGLLTVNIINNIVVNIGEVLTISFQGNKVP